MPDLADVEDLVARLGRVLTEDEQARAAALLADASALVRDFTRQEFTTVAGDVIVLRPVGALLRLPQRPVTAVTAVEAVLGDGTSTAALSGWTWDGRDKVDLTQATWTTPPAPGASPWPNTYRVTYDHGDADVPPGVVAVVCAMVLRTLLSPSMTAGMVAERIGSYNYQLQQGSGAAGATVVMTAADEKALARWGPRRAGTIQVAAG
ncbi:hypothetical protein QCN29_26785 [Streptomyces sp. HNM0663]|uniref:Phage gp6-like head-tail connector protein n=1 Tax=Streptomyces chengmaiensis TaxID=3040919 RepID=A0ABT6HUB3_9ACTN|nr:hypothetical protein [Streptomyces chengmaiensis]MDH2392318.1 hypothetical protein [Streptomyces chengmaiensis]